jgi:hypothetical protein
LSEEEKLILATEEAERANSKSSGDGKKGDCILM